MKDIDFDELDRAVSSVLGQKVSAASDEKKLEDVKVKPSGTTDPTEKVTLENPPVSPSPSIIPDRPKPPIRRGRFMDVVRPAASSNSSSVDRFPSRAAPSIQPISNEISEAPSTPVPPPNVQDKEDETTFNVSVSNKSTVSASEPDSAHLLEAQTDDTGTFTPTDAELTGNGDTKREENLTVDPATYSEAPALDRDLDDVIDAPEAEKSKVERDEEEAIPVSSSLADTVSQTTPFLSDTKVDKRPLGGFPENEEEFSSNENRVEPDTQVPPTVPMPRELQADIVGVESPAYETNEPKSDLPFATSIAAAAEPQDDGRVEGHPIFDTSTYHEPIIAVHESSVPTWVKWLLGLAICLALGAGVGYFLFTAGL